MEAKERINLREQLLSDLYDFHFNNNGKEKLVLDEVKNNDEINLAYIYLDDKGLVNYKPEIAGRDRNYVNAFVKITNLGIDYVENERK